ncbi:hypothetical protein [Paenibacillus gansuensis]|uniref:Uncharacterized protein n=1 Tax=Paenibacillus gansuensis TaxID=306542 RepID=A0ABW5P9J7_9BACL
MISTAMIILLLLSTDVYNMVKHPAAYRAWRAALNFGIGCLSIVLAALFYWNAYRPRVGPVGNGPDHEQVWWLFVWMLGTGIVFIIMGCVGLWIRAKSKYDHTEVLNEIH